MDLLPFDVLVYLLSFVPNRKRNLLSVRLSCKRLLAASKEGFDPSKRRNWAIKRACEVGYLPSVKEILKDPRVDPTCRENFCLFHCAQEGKAECLKAIMDHAKVDPSCNESYALRLACTTGNDEVVRVLLRDTRVDPTVCNFNPMLCAISYDYGAIVNVLLDHDKVKNAGEQDFFTWEAMAMNEPSSLYVLQTHMAKHGMRIRINKRKNQTIF
jgi:hypothetical protein